jgi:plastocyanin
MVFLSARSCRERQLEERTSMRRIKLGFLVLAATLATAACSTPAGTISASSAPTTGASAPGASTGGGAACAPAPAGATAAVTVEIKDFKFAPQPVQANVGDVIAWTNNDTVPHTASLADGSCSTDQLAGGSTGALVFSVAGTYTYQCNVHPGQMKDYTIEVK